MGQSMSSEDIRAVKQEVYAYYPGLEQQLEMAFSCHDFGNEGELEYCVLEPVLRHLLMQYGLIEYVTRFSSETTGVLDIKHVASELGGFGVDIHNPLDCEAFKGLAVVWLKKILDTHQDDQAEWSEKLREQQEQQSEEYMQAMKSFQEQYTLQQAVYQQGLDEQQKQISDWNKAIEDTHRTQQEVYEAEVKRMQDIQEREKNIVGDAIRDQQRIVEQYQSRLMAMAAEDNKHGISFTYPIGATPFGACASAGAQEPARRKPKSKKSTVKLVKNCC